MRKLIAVSLSALILLLWPILRPAAAGPAHVALGDVNGDGALDISDPIWLLRHIFADGPPPVSAASSELEARVARLEERELTDEQREMLRYIWLGETATSIHTSNVPTIFFSGVNVQIVNGMGSTNGNNPDPASIDECCGTNGTGNLIIGYQEQRYPFLTDDPEINEDQRTGSHNLVIGAFNNYTAAGGIVSGYSNEIGGPYSSAIGMFNETAGTGAGSAVSGGIRNFVNAPNATISGGVDLRLEVEGGHAP